MLKGKPALVVEVDAAEKDTPAVVRRRAQDERRAKAVEAIQSDAFVQDLCKTFGAKVDPELVQPVSESDGADSGN